MCEAVYQLYLFSAAKFSRILTAVFCCCCCFFGFKMHAMRFLTNLEIQRGRDRKRDEIRIEEGESDGKEKSYKCDNNANQEQQYNSFLIF